MIEFGGEYQLPESMESSKNIVNVTESFAPPFEEVEVLLKEIWASKWFTNRGPLVKKLEERIKSTYRTNDLLIVNNGTIAIQLAIRSLQNERKKEIITTPFSYVATTSSIVWEGKEPVFADIDPKTLCIDPAIKASSSAAPR